MDICASRDRGEPPALVSVDADFWSFLRDADLARSGGLVDRVHRPEPKFEPKRCEQSLAGQHAALFCGRRFALDLGKRTRDQSRLLARNEYDMLGRYNIRDSANACCHYG